MSLNGARSGPAISTMPFRGVASATSATMAATSSGAMGWNRPGESLTMMFPSALEAAMPPRNSRNLGRAAADHRDELAPPHTGSQAQTTALHPLRQVP